MSGINHLSPRGGALYDERMTTTNTRPAVLTETQIAAIDALSRVSALDPHLTRAQRHDIHVLTAQIAGLPHPTCCA